MINIAVLGHGVVGSGVVELIEQNQQQVAANAGQALYVKRILDLRDFEVPYADKFTKDYQDILNDAEISVVAEVMGGVHPAFEFTKAALEQGKSVVTSNKELVARKGAELLHLAKKHNVNYYFEASVGGGIPVIHPMHHCLAANKIKEVAGILNGTTNFILSKMIHEGMDFGLALKTAQELGYAERDPSADIDGHDACRKICILASLAFSKHVYPEQVYTEGITKITADDVAYALNYDCVIKLIGRVKQQPDGNLVCMVSPAMINKNSPLAVIEDVFNGIMVRGNATGDVLFYGRGAGKLPTASAVVADIIDAATANGTSNSLTWEDDGQNHVLDYRETAGDFLVRIQGEHASQRAQELFGPVTFLFRKNKPADEFAFIVENMREDELLKKEELLECDGISVVGKIRILKY